MKSQQKKVLSLLLIILASACLCGSALAQAPERYVRTNSDILVKGNVCAESGSQGNSSANATLNVKSVGVKLKKGKFKLYNADNEIITEIDVAHDGDSSIVIVVPGQKDEQVIISFLESSVQLLRNTEIDGKEITLVPIRVEYTDTDAISDFDAYIDWQSIMNFEQLVLAYQGWYPALPDKTPDPLYTGISTKLSEIDEELQDISDRTQTLSFSMAQLIQGSKLELYQLIGIGISVLLAIILLILWLVYARNNRKRLKAHTASTEEQGNTIQQTFATVCGIASHLNETANETNRQLDFITQLLLKTPPPPPPPIDRMKEFLGRVNSSTMVNASEQWRQSLMEYKPEFLKYDAIQNWFSREGAIGDPLFAVCSIPSSNETQLCLIPSCYDTKLASSDLSVAYDVIKPLNGESIRTYKIDRAAVLEPFGVYFRIVTRGQITLLP